MNIPDAAIEAAAEAAYTSMYVGSNIAMLPWKSLHSITRNREIDRARAALSAAMPAIREALAQEIAEVVGDELATQSEFMHETHNPQFRQGILWASLHTRVFLTEIWKPNVRGGTP